jgi:type VI protein secretion system component VasK
MSNKIFLTLLAVLALIFGLAFVVAPANFGDLIGLESSASMVTVARMMGAAMLAWGLILWSARHFQEEAQAAILQATGVADAAGAASAFVACLTDAMNAYGWVIAVILLLAAMGCMKAVMTTARGWQVARGASGTVEWPVA